MRNEIHRLINEGLYLHNLTKLIPLCRAATDENPALYGTLTLLLCDLVTRFDGETFEVEEYTGIINSIQPLLLSLIACEGESAEDFTKKLNDLMAAYRRVVFN